MTEASEHSVVFNEVVERPDTVVEQAANMEEEAIPVANMAEHEVTKEDDETEAKWKKPEKTLKEYLALNIAIIAVAFSNKNRPGSRSPREVNFLGICVACAMTSFLIWAFLLILIQLMKIGKIILSGSFVIGILCMAIGFMFLCLTFWV